MHRPFSEPWAAAFADAINADADYRAAGARWTWPVTLVLAPAAPELGYPEPIGVRLDLDRGTCREARLGAPDALAADFVLTAPYATWKRIVTGAVDAMTAVATREMTLQGPMMTLLLQAAAAQALVACALKVPAMFPDESN